MRPRGLRQANAREEDRGLEISFSWCVRNGHIKDFRAAIIIRRFSYSFLGRDLSLIKKAKWHKLKL